MGQRLQGERWRVGGRFSSRREAKDASAGFDFAGAYTKVIPHELIACEFGDRSLVVQLSQTDKGITDRETFDAEETYSPEQQRAGWQAILDRFKRYVESGRGHHTAGKWPPSEEGPAQPTP